MAPRLRNSPVVLNCAMLRRHPGETPKRDDTERTEDGHSRNGGHKERIVSAFSDQPVRMRIVRPQQQESLDIGETVNDHRGIQRIGQISDGAEDQSSQEIETELR